MNVALKEWDAVARAMQSGAHHVLLRKGGIADPRQEFRLEHTRFWIFPTFEHQTPALIAPAHQRFYEDSVRNAPAAGTLRFECWAEVERVRAVTDLSQLQSFAAFHIWSDEYLKQRLAYKPEKPLYLCLVRSHRLNRPLPLPDLPRYAGCRSWVPLDNELETRDSQPALPDSEWNRVRETALRLL